MKPCYLSQLVRGNKYDKIADLTTFVTHTCRSGMTAAYYQYRAIVAKGLEWMKKRKKRIGCKESRERSGVTDAATMTKRD